MCFTLFVHCRYVAFAEFVQLQHRSPHEWVDFTNIFRCNVSLENELSVFFQLDAEDVISAEVIVLEPFAEAFIQYGMLMELQSSLVFQVLGVNHDTNDELRIKPSWKKDATRNFKLYCKL